MAKPNSLKPHTMEMFTMNTQGLKREMCDQIR